MPAEIGVLLGVSILGSWHGTARLAHVHLALVGRAVLVARRQKAQPATA